MTIVRLTSSNHHEVLKLFGKEIENYYFFINDLVTHDYQNVYGEYENEELVSILTSHLNNVTYYSPFNRDVTIYEEVIHTLTFHKLSGPSQLMEKFKPFVHVKEDTHSNLGVVKSIAVKRRYPDLAIKIVRTDEEIGRQYDLLLLSDEFFGSIPKSKNQYIQMEKERLKTTSDRTVYISIGDRMISSAATIREGEKCAIIIGVCTDPLYRGKGYGTEVLIGLFDQLLKEGKYPYLFYNNPVARHVYKNLGMTEVCDWRVLKV